MTVGAKHFSNLLILDVLVAVQSVINNALIYGRIIRLVVIRIEVDRLQCVLNIIHPNGNVSVGVDEDEHTDGRNYAVSACNGEDVIAVRVEASVHQRLIGRRKRVCGAGVGKGLSALHKRSFVAEPE